MSSCRSVRGGRLATVRLAVTRDIERLTFEQGDSREAFDQAIDHGEERRLAATGRTDNGDELAVHHRKIDAVERDELRIGARLQVGEPDVLGFEFWGHAATCGRQTSTRRSMRRMSSTSATPAAAMVSMPTNTLSVSKREPAWLIMAPMPAEEP